jgi:ATP-dependent DNA helicase PIF1
MSCGFDDTLSRCITTLSGKGGFVANSLRPCPRRSISIHKSQGMSIDFLEISLDDCFAEGQAYVAISRARSLEGLRVVSFNPKAFKTNPRVWLSRLHSHIKR